MAQPLVSVIVTSAAAGDPVEEALASVRAQTFTNHECIVPDFCPSLAAARNLGIRKAQGEFIAFLDADHRWNQRKLEKQLARLAEDAASQWCYCQAESAAVPQRTPAGQILRPLLLDNFIPPSSVVVRRQALVETGIFEEAGGDRSSGDWDMWLRLAARHPVVAVPQALVQLQRPTSEIEQSYGSRLRVVEAAVARHQTLLDLRSEALAEICVSAGNSYLTANNPMDARQKFAEALTHNPLRSDAYLNWVSSFFSAEAQQQIRDLQGLSRFTRLQR